MDEVLKILQGKKYRITKLTINNFTTKPEEYLSIDMYIRTENEGNKKLHFSKVQQINIYEGPYILSECSFILIEETTDLQPSVLTYKIAIDEDVMSFYCEKMEMEDVLAEVSIDEFRSPTDIFNMNYTVGIFELLQGKYRIMKLTLNNFTAFAWMDDISIDIHLQTEKYGDKILHFSPTREIKIKSPTYRTTLHSSIIVTDISNRQWCECLYEIRISEDIMSFYCKYIEIV